MEEYDTEGREETVRALKALQEYCESPDCDTWQTVSRLKSPKRYVHAFYEIILNMKVCLSVGLCASLFLVVLKYLETLNFSFFYNINMFFYRLIHRWSIIGNFSGVSKRKWKTLTFN